VMTYTGVLSSRKRPMLISTCRMSSTFESGTRPCLRYCSIVAQEYLSIHTNAKDVYSLRIKTVFQRRHRDYCPSHRTLVCYKYPHHTLVNLIAPPPSLYCSSPSLLTCSSAQTSHPSPQFIRNIQILLAIAVIAYNAARPVASISTLLVRLLPFLFPLTSARRVFCPVSICV